MDTFLRIISRLFIVTLATSFGIGTGAVGVYFGFVAAFGELGRDDWGAAPIWLMAMAIGALVGAIFMAVSSFSWTLGEQFRAFNLFEWLGVVLGGLAGGIVFWLLPLRIYLWARCVIMAALLPLCILVAFLAIRALVMAFQRQKKSPTPKSGNY